MWHPRSSLLQQGSEGTLWSASQPHALKRPGHPRIRISFPDCRTKRLGISASVVHAIKDKYDSQGMLRSSLFSHGLPSEAPSGARSEGWCGRRESNSPFKLGKVTSTRMDKGFRALVPTKVLQNCPTILSRTLCFPWAKKASRPHTASSRDCFPQRESELRS